MKVIYTASNVRVLIEELKGSLESLTKFVRKKDIEVHLTPPHPAITVRKQIEPFARIIIEDENKTPEFQLTPTIRGRFCEKIAILNRVEGEEVLFLDCDTRINRDPNELFKDDFHVSARVAEGYKYFNFNKWNNLFLSLELTPIPMINAGVMAFKGGVHKRITDKALKYLDKKLPKCAPRYYHLDQYVLSLAFSEYDIRWMSPKEHGYRFNHESKDTIIFHGGKRSINHELVLLGQMVVNYVTS
jgi:hypothetical protein